MDDIKNDSIKRQVNVRRLWDIFKDELIYSNRFFPYEKIENRFLDRIDNIMSIYKSTVRKGSLWYRAREYFIKSPAIYSNKELSLMSDDERKKFNEINDELFFEENLMNTAKTIKSYEEFSDDYSSDLDYFNNLIKSFECFLEKEKTSVWGYDKKGSGIAPREQAGLNRASPKYISYLYLAKNSNTALAEVKAVPNQLFSVAKYKINKQINVINFSNLSTMPKLSDEEMTIYNCIYMAFSSPTQYDEKDYIISQYISEYIKRNGYDGVMFNSSRNIGGVNLTLFYDDICDFLGSSIHEVTEIKVKTRQLLPLSLKKKGDNP